MEAFNSYQNDAAQQVSEANRRWRVGQKLFPMKIRDTKETLLVTNADLSGSSFTDVNLREAQFTDVNLSKAKFADINLSGTTFTDVNLSNVEIQDCNISGLKIQGVRYRSF
jgi:uncharacterized protein YjbI with pentapeptide repeats